MYTPFVCKRTTQYPVSILLRGTTYRGAHLQIYRIIFYPNNLYFINITIHPQNIAKLLINYILLNILTTVCT